MGILDAPSVPRSAQGQADLEAQRATALRPFWAALANRAAAPVDILAVGHSYVEGVHSSSVNRTMPAFLRDGLRNRFPVAGVAGGFGYHTTPFISYFTDDPLVNTGGTADLANGLGRKARSMTATGHKRVLTFTGTGVDIFYSKFTTGGTGYYSIDGGAQTTFATANSVGGLGAFHTLDGQRIQITGLTAGSHTVEVGWSSGGPVFSEGFMIYNGDETKGIRIWNGGHSSQQSNYFNDNVNSAWVQTVSVIQPALVVLTLLCNDFAGATTSIASATSKANLQNLIGQIRAKCTKPPSFVLCTEFERVAAGGAAAIEPWANYVAAAKQIAAADSSVVVWEMGPRFGQGPFAAATTVVDPDLIHPSDAGHQLWADGLVSFLSPR